MADFTKPLMALDIEADVYMIRAMRRSPGLIMNYRYEEVRLLDAVHGTVTGSITLPEPDFAIYKCMTGGDGSRAYLFSHDDIDFLVELDLVAKTSRKIAISPGFDVPTGLCWFAPAFTVLDCQDGVWQIRGDALVRAGGEQVDRLYTADLRNLTQRFIVHKIDLLGGGLYVRSRTFPVPKFGMLDIGGGAELLFSDDGKAIDCVHHGSDLFVVYDTRVVRFSGDQETDILLADDNHAYIAAEVVAAEDRSYLCVLLATKDYLDGPVATVATYPLD